MNFKETIGILTKLARDAWAKDKVKDADACQLGIEALERIEYCRSGHFEEIFKLLPGETAD